MPQPKRQKLEPDRVVEALVPDPAAGPPDVTVLRGFLGRSPDDGVWRLFVTAALDEYIDIPESEILHSEKLPDDGGTVLWVAKTLELNYVRVQAQRVQAEFLGGPVTSARAAMPPTPGPEPAPQPRTFGFACPSVLTPCESQTIPCQSDFVICQSQLTPCISIPRLRCPSVTIPCDSQLTIRCQSSLTPCISVPRFTCPSVLTPCQSKTIPCQSDFVRCPSDICPSERTICPSVGICPSELGCPSDFCDPGGGFNPIR
jgi:hypothetical protein